MEKRRVFLGRDCEDVMDLRPDQRGGGAKVGYSLDDSRRPNGVRVRKKERATESKRFGITH